MAPHIPDYTRGRDTELRAALARMSPARALLAELLWPTPKHLLPQWEYDRIIALPESSVREEMKVAFANQGGISLASVGGRARAYKLSPERRREIARSGGMKTAARRRERKSNRV